MPPTSTIDSFSIFKNGKLKPGVYKIQNIRTEMYVDIDIYSRGLCGRPARDLDQGRGFWEIKEFGAGYTVQRVEPGKPEQFCTALEGTENHKTLRVSAYPAAWRVEIVDDKNHRGFEYVRFYWATSNVLWDLANPSGENGTKIQTLQELEGDTTQMWRLIPVKSEYICTSLDAAELAQSPPPHDRDAESSTRAEHTESGQDELGTFVNKVTVVTTTVTTRERYRVEDSS